MAKVKSDKIPHYELLYIVSNKFTEDEEKPIIKNVNEIIESYKGINIASEEWGKRKLAYPIKGFSHGYYILVDFDVEANQLKKISDKLRMTSEVLRFQIIVKDLEKAKRAKKEVIKTEEKKKTEIAEKPKKEKEEKKKKVDLEELDKKLDKILDTDDLL